MALQYADRPDAFELLSVDRVKPTIAPRLGRVLGSKAASAPSVDRNS